MSQEHLPPWKVLIVDDEPDVITTTRHTLMDVTVLGRPLELLTAESAASAERLLQQHLDVAVVLLDVVMEKIQSGLTLIDRVRNDFNNPGVRIILRTGKAGEAPEQAIVFRYAIDDYIDKGSVTRNRLITAVVTAIRSFEQFKRLERLNQRFELMIASIGHDLRSPLQVIQSSLSLLGKSSSASERMQRSQSALFATKTLARLVDDILDVARGHNLSFQNQTVDLRRWFDQFTGSFASKVDSKKLKFVSVFSANCTHIEIDPDRLGQCVGNLLDNAIRYTDRGRIEIRVDLDVGKTPGAHEELCITVLDTGRGIGQDDLARIFEPFERVTTPNSPSGTGLGLSIVANLAKGLGGSVEVSSQLSVGSQFTLRLPVSLSLLPLRPVGPSTSLVEPDAMLVIAKESAPDILVVDDDLDICRSVADVLRDGGYGCDTASNAEQALLKIEDHHYKVVLTDIQMPGLNGFEFAHLLTMSDNPPYVIAMTAYIEGFTNDPRSNYFRSKLKKPFEEEALLTQISIALDSY